MNKKLQKTGVLLLNFQDICTQYAQIAKDNATVTNGIYSVKLNRILKATIQGRPSRSALPAVITFESLDITGFLRIQLFYKFTFSR